jgi:hypothetical protein
MRHSIWIALLLAGCSGSSASHPHDDDLGAPDAATPAPDDLTAAVDDGGGAPSDQASAPTPDQAAPSSPDAASDAGATALVVTVKDENGALTPARLSIYIASGNTKTYFPLPGIKTRVEAGFDVGSGNFVPRVSYFYIDGAATLPVPADTVLTVEVHRGIEYTPVKTTVTVPAGVTTPLNVNLARWANQSLDGWYSGDSHIHLHYGNDYFPNIGVTEARRMVQAEDLNVANLLVANRATTDVYDQASFTGAPVAITPRYSYSFNEEFRSTVGHLVLLNLTALIPPFFSGLVPNFGGGTWIGPKQDPSLDEIAQTAHGQGGLVIQAHPLFGAPGGGDSINPGQGSYELPVDAALGDIDSMDLLHLLSDETSARIMLYKLWNTGIKLAVTAGTDIELDTQVNATAGDPMGANRAYVKIDGDFSYAKWIAGIKAFHTFCTDGPMLEMTVDGAGIGETLYRAGGDLANGVRVHVFARARARFPIDRLQIIVNGENVDATEVAGGANTLTFDKDVTLDKSSWIAARISEQPGSADVDDAEVFAHTSPVWVILNDAPLRSATDAQFLVNWIDAYKTTLTNDVPDGGFSAGEKTSMLARVDSARAYYAAQIP